MALRQSISFAVHHPVDEAYFPFVKFYHLFRSDADALGWINGWSVDPRPVLLSPAAKDAWSTLANLYYLPLMVVAGLGMPLWFSVKDKRKLILVAFVGAWVAVHLMLWPSGRYHVALTPLFSLWAAVTVIARVRSAGRPARHNRSEGVAVSGARTRERRVERRRRSQAVAESRLVERRRSGGAALLPSGWSRARTWR